ncbi:MAG: YggS family pyridoxal phosphate-dependent enzyme [Pseudomonadota bacterium]
MTLVDTQQNLLTILDKIKKLELDHNYAPNKVRLIAVSKTRSASEIRMLAGSGQVDFGENYVQEAIDKISELTDQNITWHFIGPIQKNKTKAISQHFHWVHTIERDIIATRLSEQRPQNLPALNVCIQINIDNETSKSGITPHELHALAGHIDQLPNLTLRGLMAIPSVKDNYSEQCKTFNKMQDLLADLKEQGYDVDTLSMGMSNDYEAAIVCGSTMVRLGTVIFGPRASK